MKLLLDTHILLWWLAGDPRLPRAAEAIIGDTANAVHVSAASFWEVAIKSALGRIDVDLDDVVAAMRTAGFFELPITSRHSIECGRLPLRHRDPFDRMLVAQSRIEPLRLVTHDRALADYGETVLLL